MEKKKTPEILIRIVKEYWRAKEKLSGFIRFHGGV